MVVEWIKWDNTRKVSVNYKALHKIVTPGIVGCWKSKSFSLMMLLYKMLQETVNS